MSRVRGGDEDRRKRRLLKKKNAIHVEFCKLEIVGFMIIHLVGGMRRPLVFVCCYPVAVKMQ